MLTHFMHFRMLEGRFSLTELEVRAGHRTFSDQNGKITDQVPICLDMNPIGFLLCPSKSYHARTELMSDQNSILISSSALLYDRCNNAST